MYLTSSRFPPVIKNLLILNGLGFMAQFMMRGVAPGLMESQLGLLPLGYGFWPWQLVTYAFLHGGLWHLFFNMFALWMFGAQIESTWGARRFAFFYFACVIGAALAQLAVQAVSDTGYPYRQISVTIGASGGVFGILAAFGMLFPNQRIMLLFPPIPLKAKYLVIGYGVLELYFAAGGGRPGVATFAHLGGMVVGVLLILYWRGSLPFKPRRRTPYY